MWWIHSPSETSKSQDCRAKQCCWKQWLEAKIPHCRTVRIKFVLALFSSGDSQNWVQGIKLRIWTLPLLGDRTILVQFMWSLGAKNNKLAKMSERIYGRKLLADTKAAFPKTTAKSKTWATTGWEAMRAIIIWLRLEFRNSQVRSSRKYKSISVKRFEWVWPRTVCQSELYGASLTLKPYPTSPQQMESVISLQHASQ